MTKKISLDTPDLKYVTDNVEINKERYTYYSHSCDSYSYDDFVNLMKERKDKVLEKHPEAIDFEVSFNVEHYQGDAYNPCEIECCIFLEFKRLESKKEYTVRIKCEEADRKTMQARKERQKADKEKQKELEKQMYFKLKEKFEHSDE